MPATIFDIHKNNTMQVKFAQNASHVPEIYCTCICKQTKMFLKLKCSLPKKKQKKPMYSGVHLRGLPNKPHNILTLYIGCLV